MIRLQPHLGSAWGGVSVPKAGCVVVSDREDEFRRPAALKTVMVNGADAEMVGNTAKTIRAN